MNQVDPARIGIQMDDAALPTHLVGTKGKGEILPGVDMATAVLTACAILVCPTAACRPRVVYHEMDVARRHREAMGQANEPWGGICTGCRRDFGPGALLCPSCVMVVSRNDPEGIVARDAHAVWTYYHADPTRAE